MTGSVSFDDLERALIDAACIRVPVEKIEQGDYSEAGRAIHNLLYPNREFSPFIQHTWYRLPGGGWLSVMRGQNTYADNQSFEIAFMDADQRLIEDWFGDDDTVEGFQSVDQIVRRVQQFNAEQTGGLDR